ncbi:Dipeptidyl aminopeptidase BIII [Biomphalaria glabrata]|nr:acylamino-acid-releasing enzyme [Biomphalaria glabrata]
MKVAGYGTWESPISSKMTTESGVDLHLLKVDDDPTFSDTVYWTEIHFQEQGRYVICSSDQNGQVVQWTPKDFNARSTVHEYGGGDFFVYHGVVYFSNFTDQVLYRQTDPSAVPEPVTDISKKYRYADGVWSPQKSLIYIVREDHEVVAQGAKEPQNSIVVIDPETKLQSVLVSGADFYSCPRVSPDGHKIAWVQWNHPNMPWDSTEIWLAELSKSGHEVLPGTQQKVAGGKDASGQDLSVIQPFWTANNELLYIEDETDWWNLYRVTKAGVHINMYPTSAEIGGPQWIFGKTPYAIEPNGGTRIVTSFNGELGILDTKDLSYRKVETGLTTHDRFGWTSRGSIYSIAYSANKFAQVIRVDANTEEVQVIKVSMSPPVDIGYFSIPEKISWQTTDNEISFGLYYAPTNKDFIAPDGELPPLLVRAHGGPTSSFSSNLDLKLQYFTSRGFAVLCVDYRGSVGYGKKYRHRLRGQWGKLDIEDCSTGGKYLASVGKIDPKKVCIDGRSAGGYTTLACLTFTDTFKAGVSHFGISDLEILMQDTHKFESRYLDTLLAPLDQGGRELCKDRSPIHHINNIQAPMGFFQGDEDKVVPPNQAEMMYEAVKAKGLPAMFVLFQGEQHGFRKAENIQTSLDGEFYFFGKVLGFEPAEKHIKLHIDNI